MDQTEQLKNSKVVTAEGKKGEAPTEPTDGKVKLSELLLAILEWKKNPADEKAYQHVNDMISRIGVKESLSLIEKKVAMVDALSVVTSPDLDAVDAEVELTMGKFFYGVLAYATNFENDLGADAVDETIYDYLTNLFHLDDYILGTGQYSQGCYADYIKLEKMIDGAINFSNVFRIANTAELMSSENLDKFHEAINELNHELTPERIAQLKSITVDAEPGWEALKGTIGDAITSEVMAKTKKALETVSANEEKGVANDTAMRKKAVDAALT